MGAPRPWQGSWCPCCPRSHRKTLHPRPAPPPQGLCMGQPVCGHFPAQTAAFPVMVMDPQVTWLSWHRLPEASSTGHWLGSRFHPIRSPHAFSFFLELCSIHVTALFKNSSGS